MGQADQLPVGPSGGDAVAMGVLLVIQFAIGAEGIDCALAFGQRIRAAAQ